MMMMMNNWLSGL